MAKKSFEKNSDLRAVQKACLYGAIAHSFAILATIYCFRAGDLSQFSVERLMSFAAIHPLLWQINSLALLTACLSLTYFLICLYKIAPAKDAPRKIFCLFLVMIALTVDVQTFFNLMLHFVDVSYRSLYDTALNRSILRLEGWMILDQALGRIFILSNILYALAGYHLTEFLLEKTMVSRRIGQAGQVIWILLFLVSILTFASLVPQAIFLFFWTIVLFIVWLIVLYVNADGLTQQSETKADAETEADNKDN